VGATVDESKKVCERILDGNDGMSVEVGMVLGYGENGPTELGDFVLFQNMCVCGLSS
jgi:hypothetical protein